MKKILIALLAILLLVSFTSCDTQKKIDEAVAANAAETKETLISYSKTSRAISNYCYVIGRSDCVAGEYDLSNYESTDGTTKTAAEKAIYMLLAESNSNEYSAFSSGSGTKTITKASGKVKIEKSEDGTAYTMTATGVSIKASYTPTKSETHYKEIKDATLTLDGVIYNKTTSNEDKTETTTDCKVTGFKQNGTQYKDIEYSYTTTEDGTTYTKAVCDGKNIDLDYLNQLYAY